MAVHDIKIEVDDNEAINFVNVCCGKKMEKITDNINGEEHTSWVCNECGNFFVFKHGQLDEEELEEEMQK